MLGTQANRRRFRVAGKALLCNPPCDYLQAGSPSPAVDDRRVRRVHADTAGRAGQLRVRVRRGPVAGARRDRRQRSRRSTR